MPHQHWFFMGAPEQTFKEAPSRDCTDQSVPHRHAQPLKLPWDEPRGGSTQIKVPFSRRLACSHKKQSGAQKIETRKKKVQKLAERAAQLIVFVMGFSLWSSCAQVPILVHLARLPDLFPCLPSGHHPMNCARVASADESLQKPRGAPEGRRSALWPLSPPTRRRLTGSHPCATAIFKAAAIPRQWCETFVFAGCRWAARLSALLIPTAVCVLA